MALISAIATGTVMLAFCVPLALYVRTAAYDRAVDAAELQARSLAAELATVRGAPAVSRLVMQANSASDSKATAYLSGGIRIGGATRRPQRVPPAVLGGRATTVPAPDGGRLVWEPVHDPVAAWAVVVRVPPAALSGGVARTWAMLFGGGALLVLIGVALADRLGRSIVRSLQELVTVTNRLRDGDLASRTRPAGPSEVAGVGEAVNELADRIDGLLENARQTAADLGHRLRTPVTALRLDVEALANQALPAQSATPRLRADLDRLEQSVNELINRSKQAPERMPSRSDLADAVRDRLAFWSVLARSQHRTANVRLPARRVDVGLSRDELDAAIDALLSNVFAHTPEGTGFSVTVERPDRGQGPWSLVVANQAPAPGGPAAADAGMPAGLAQHAAGTGLGLDIVRRTAARAGGTLVAGPTADGGFRAEVTLA